MPPVIAVGVGEDHHPSLAPNRLESSERDRRAMSRQGKGLGEVSWVGRSLHCCSVSAGVGIWDLVLLRGKTLV
jgi:hypothetical protein